MFRRHRPPPREWDAATADEDLVALAQGGEREAFAALALPAYRAGEFRSWLFAIAHNVVAAPSP
ncbi:MAG: hypothetical protein K0S78_3515 [Thermomicrobiales bacterium]|nr:hypothetical protein [Thermomicrobiales bacterium]